MGHSLLLPLPEIFTFLHLFLLGGASLISVFNSIPSELFSGCIIHSLEMLVFISGLFFKNLIIYLIFLIIPRRLGQKYYLKGVLFHYACMKGPYSITGPVSPVPP